MKQRAQMTLTVQLHTYNKSIVPLECISIECHTKWLEQPIKRMENITRSLLQLKVKTSKLPKARENASHQIVFFISFECDWSRKWREFSEPITQHSEPTPQKSRITLETQPIKNYSCVPIGQLMTTHFGKVYHGFRLVRQSLLSYQLDTATVLRYKQRRRQRLYYVKGGEGERAQKNMWGEGYNRQEVPPTPPPIMGCISTIKDLFLRHETRNKRLIKEVRSGTAFVESSFS